MLEQITFKKILPYAIFAMALFMITAILGYTEATLDPKGALNTFEDFRSNRAQPILEQSAPVQALIIIISNSIIGICAMLVGIIILDWFKIWFGSIYAIVLNGYMIGKIVYIIGKVVGIDVAVLSLLPHGILELPAIFLSAGVGLYVGYNLMLERCQTLEYNKYIYRNCIRFYVKNIFPLFIIAGFIEVYVTPYVMNFLITL